jgi:hypothetical protein
MAGLTLNWWWQVFGVKNCPILWLGGHIPKKPKPWTGFSPGASGEPVSRIFVKML